MQAAARPTTRRIYIASQVLLLAGAIALAVLSYNPHDWQPLDLFGLLLVLAALRRAACGHDRQPEPLLLLRGPDAGDDAAGPGARSGDRRRRGRSRHDRPPPAALRGPDKPRLLCDLSIAGSLLARALVGDVHEASNHALIRSPEFALTVFGVFIVANLLNFVIAAVHKRVMQGRSLLLQTRTLLVPMLPGQFAAAILTAILAIAYTNLGYPVLLGVVVVILIFQYLAIALLRSEDRAEQLEARSMHLASLQLGVLVTLVETLALRDRAAARHAASVARYARALAAELGLDESQQDLVHTASLLHDIGKFALPDRILHAEVLSDADWSTIRRHPQDGATLVGRLDGYGPVSDIILYHHEHVNGSGYPAGLIGNEIPLLARVLSVCNTFDTLTARDSYRSPMTPQDAIAELRRVAGRQLDSEIVQSFAAMIEREGPASFMQAQGADFEAELSFERRARALAAPAKL